MTDPPRDPGERTGLPRWLWVLGITAVLIGLLVVIVILTGGHSIGPPPGGH